MQMKSTGLSLADYVDGLQGAGRYTFTAREARQATGLKQDTLQKAARRLVLARRLCSPREGFFVTVPLEYQSASAPPPTWFIHDLMQFIGQPYYVGMLSAAALHGAGHQQPQEFQVVTSAPLPLMHGGRARLRFVVKRKIEATPTLSLKTDTGSIAVSTPEATALDLVRYVKACGGLSHVATVLAELSEKIEPAQLVEAARIDGERSVAQRLGYVLGVVEAAEKAAALAAWLSGQRTVYVPLRPTRATRGLPRDDKWKVLVNAAVEPDEGIG
jgi:predicted transcriptional regulator of viral defense system